jgi:hypothetical protein
MINVKKSKKEAKAKLTGCHAKEEEEKIFTYLIFSFKDPHVRLFKIFLSLMFKFTVP